MNIILSIILWAPFIIIKAILFIVGIFIVAIKMKLKGDMTDGVYRIAEGRPNTYWEAAWRNPVGGIDHWIQHPVPYDSYTSYHTKGVPNPEPTMHKKRFVWRFNSYKLLSSLRLVWRYSENYYGEIYIGWKLGSEPPKMDFALSPRVIPRKVGT